MISGFVTLMFSNLLFAHHGTGVSYDMHRVVVLKGNVTRLVLQNPHSRLYFDVSNENGKLSHWVAEMRNPRILESYGLTKQFLQKKFAPGTQIIVTGNPSKLGAPIVVFGKAVAADGWCLCNHEGGIGSDGPEDIDPIK